MRRSMRLSCLGPLLVALSITPLGTLPAQAPAQPDSEQMTIHVTVFGHNGEPVDGLTKDDFTLTENKHQKPGEHDNEYNELQVKVRRPGGTLYTPPPGITRDRSSLNFPARRSRPMPIDTCHTVLDVHIP